MSEIPLFVGRQRKAAGGRGGVRKKEGREGGGCVQGGTTSSLRRGHPGDTPTMPHRGGRVKEPDRRLENCSHNFCFVDLR